jgi:hypothetical protein
MSTVPALESGARHIPSAAIEFPGSDSDSDTDPTAETQLRLCGALFEQEFRVHVHESGRR